MTCECCDNWNSWSFGDPVLHHPKWIQCDLLKPITLSLSSHTIQSVNNNPWRHWKDPQTSQVNKCPDIFRKCPTGTKLRIAWKIQGKLITPLEPSHSERSGTRGQTWHRLIMWCEKARSVLSLFLFLSSWWRRYSDFQKLNLQRDCVRSEIRDYLPRMKFAGENLFSLWKS